MVGKDGEEGKKVHSQGKWKEEGKGVSPRVPERTQAYRHFEFSQVKSFFELGTAEL